MRTYELFYANPLFEKSLPEFVVKYDSDLKIDDYPNIKDALNIARADFSSALGIHKDSHVNIYPGYNNRTASYCFILVSREDFLASSDIKIPKLKTKIEID